MHRDEEILIETPSGGDTCALDQCCSLGVSIEYQFPVADWMQTYNIPHFFDYPTVYTRRPREFSVILMYFVSFCLFSSFAAEVDHHFICCKIVGISLYCGEEFG